MATPATRRLLIVLGVLGGLAAGGASHAAASSGSCLVTDLRTGFAEGTLQEAVDAASAGDTLRVRGTCYGHATITKTLSLVGQSSSTSGPAMLDGGGSASPGSVIIDEAVLTVKGITITGGYNGECAIHPFVEPEPPENPNAEKGGGIYVKHTSLILSNTRIIKNLAEWGEHGCGGQTYGGGGIYNDGGSISVNSSTVAQNTGGPGGGIANIAGTAKLSHTTVTENTAASSAGGVISRATGGGIYSAEGLLSITNHSIVSANTVHGGWGGGIVGSGSVTVSSSTVQDNVVGYGHGAGIILGGGSLRVTNSIVSNNAVEGTDFTPASGGGIEIDEGSATLSGSTISGNSVGRGDEDSAAIGGGIYNNAKMLTLTNTNVVGNLSGRGAGIGNATGASVTLKGSSSIVENVASADGGGVYNAKEAKLVLAATWTGTISGNQPDDVFNE